MTTVWVTLGHIRATFVTCQSEYIHLRKPISDAICGKSHRRRLKAKAGDQIKCDLYVLIFCLLSFQWQKLEMSTVERRKIMCSVTFHIIAITCVIWSLYVLIDRTTQEIKLGILEWPFWTKLIVVAIGFTGGLVFMYVQCKMYVQLCRRWRAYNRVIYIQNCPEKKKKPLNFPIDEKSDSQNSMQETELL